MNSKIPRILSALLLAALTAAPAFADDEDDDRGSRRDRKEAFWDGPCRVEREWKKDGDYKEERKCQDLGDRYAERKEEFRSGGCKIKREWKKNGDYVEERDCDGRGRRYNGGQYAVAPVYPPWVVVDAGQPVYRAGRAPAPVQVPVRQCQSETVGRVLGGVAGAVLANQAGKGSDGRAVLTVGGAVVGAIVGGEIGRRIDAGNQACIAQALEFAPVGQRVAWADDGMQYAVVPGRAAARGRDYCRPYEVEVLTEQGWRRSKATACRRGDGVWVAG